MEKTITTRTPNQTMSTLKDLFKANDELIAQGKLPLTVSLIGEHGIGKSTVCQEAAVASNKGYYKLNLAQLTEPSELIGYYTKEYLVTKDKEEKWVVEGMIPTFVKEGFHYEGSVRTRPCPPDWVVNIPENGLLILDDFSRANTLFSQAVMELKK
jgi:MoxR-like ATPase